jgi:hypothetical protein
VFGLRLHLLAAAVVQRRGRLVCGWMLHKLLIQPFQKSSRLARHEL